MTYFRHRVRSVHESVFQDLRDTLIACRWMAGTTFHAVRDPDSGAQGVITTAPDHLYALLEGTGVSLIDFFPEAQDENDSGTTAPNTLALDSGRPGEPRELELGSSTMEQPYVFAMAFYAASDALAQAVMSDLTDRYQGRIVNGDDIVLYNALDSSDSPVGRMDVDAFRYTRSSPETSTPYQVNLYFAELAITDIVEA